MAASITGIFTIIDRATGPMQRMEKQALKTMAAIEGVGAAADSKKFNTSTAAVDRHTTTLRKLEEQHKRTGRAQSDHTRTAAAADRVMRTVTGSTASASRETERLGTRARAASGGMNLLHTSVTRVHGALTMLKGIGSSIERVFGSLSSGANRAGIGTQSIKALETAFKSVKTAAATFASSLMLFKFPAMAAGAGVLIQAVGALGGGFIALLPKVVSLAGALQALPGAALLAAQGMGTLKLGLSGVMAAVSAGIAMQNQWSIQQRDFTQQMISAQNGVAAAHTALTNAQYDQRQSQIALTVARRDAVRELQDMEFAAQDSVLKEARAGLNIKQAREDLQKAMMSPGTTQLQLQSLRLGVQEAQAAAAQTHTAGQRARQDASRALAKDPTSAPYMKLAAAQHAVVMSSQGIVAAQRGLQQSQFELNKLVQDGSAGQSAYQTALRNLGPAAQKLVKLIVGTGRSPHSLAHEIQNLQDAAAKGLSPGLIGGFKQILSVMPQIEKQVTGTGKALGGAFQGVVHQLLGPKSLPTLLSVMHNNTKVIGVLGDAGGHLAHAFLMMAKAAEPFILDVAKLVDHLAILFDRTKSSTAGQEAMAAKFRRAEHAAKLLWDVVKNLAQAFHGVLHAATGLGNSLWAGIDKAAQKWNKWANSVSGQNKMKAWFEGLKPTLHAVGHLLNVLAVALGTMTGPSHQKMAADMINKMADWIPTLVKILTNVEKIFGPSVISAIGTFLKLIGHITQGSGPFVIYLKLLSGVLKIVDRLITEFPILGKVLAAVLSAVLIMNFTAKILLMGRAVFGVRTAWHAVRDAAMGANLAQERAARGVRSPQSPGIGGGGAASPMLAGLEQSRTWGMRSADGPGSMANPLAVFVIDQNPLSGGGGSNLSKLGKAETAAARDARLAEEAAAGGNKAGFISRTLARVPGLSKLPGIGLAADTAGIFGKGAGMLAGVTSKLPLLAKALGPIGIALSAIPAAFAFFGQKGGLAMQAQAAVSSLTMGLVHGPVTDAQKRTQGDQLFGNLAKTLQGGGQATNIGGLNANIARLKQDIASNTTGHQGMLDSHGNPTNNPMHAVRMGHVAPGVAGTQKVADDTKLLVASQQALIAALDRSSGAKAQKWGAAIPGVYDVYKQGTGNAQQATAMTVANFESRIAKMRRATGKQLLGQQLLDWAKHQRDLHLMSKASYQQIQSTVVTQLKGMGQAISVQNGQIVNATTLDWQKVGQAMTDPINQAALQQGMKLTQIDQQAVGALTSLGYSKSAALGILRSGSATKIASAGSAVSTGGGISSTPLAHLPFAQGGRLGGSGLQDTVPLVLGMAAPGELVVNRHTEAKQNAINSMVGAPPLGALVGGETKPHSAFAAGGRIPHFATGGTATWRNVVASAESLGGLGYHSNPIQSRGYSELSVPPSAANAGSALGHLPYQTRMRIRSGAHEVVAQKQDIGAGSSFNPLMGLYPGTVSDLGLSGGQFNVSIERADGQPLTGGQSATATAGKAAAKIKIPQMGVGGWGGAIGQSTLDLVGSALNARLATVSGPGGAKGGGAAASPLSGAPAMQAMITKANEIASHNYPYQWGGGHNTLGVGPYDCSGAVSAVLGAGGFLQTPMTSGAFMNWGLPGPGAADIFAQTGHVFMSLNGRQFGTSGSNPGGGANWFSGHGTSGFVERHVPGLAKGGRAISPDILRRAKGDILPGLAWGGTIPAWVSPASGPHSDFVSGGHTYNSVPGSTSTATGRHSAAVGAAAVQQAVRQVYTQRHYNPTSGDIAYRARMKASGHPVTNFLAGQANRPTVVDPATGRPVNSGAFGSAFAGNIAMGNAILAAGGASAAAIAAQFAAGRPLGFHGPTAGVLSFANAQVGGTKLSPQQQTFAQVLAQRTGLDPRVIIAWMAAEQAPGALSTQGQNTQNWLSINGGSPSSALSTDPRFANPTSAANATADFLQGKWGGASGGIKALLGNAVGKSPAQQMAAINNSGWLSGGYQNLQSLYSQAGGGGTATSTTTGGALFTSHGGSSGFFPDPVQPGAMDFAHGQEPQLEKSLDTLGRALGLHIQGASGWRSPAHSVQVGGFANDPHTKGMALDAPGIEGVSEATLNRYGLTRPFPGAAEADHIQLIGKALGGRLGDAGWNYKGGTFTTNGPTVFGAGEGGRRERVTVQPLNQNATHGGHQFHVEIHHVDYRQEGDIAKAIEREMDMLADTLGGP